MPVMPMVVTSCRDGPQRPQPHEPRQGARHPRMAAFGTTAYQLFRKRHWQRTNGPASTALVRYAGETHALADKQRTGEVTSRIAYNIN